MKNTLINAGVLLDATTDIAVLTPWTGVDAVLTALMAYNSHSGALTVTITLWEVFIVTSVAAGATVNLIDGLELPVKAGDVLYASTTTADLVTIKPLGAKASEGNMTTHAVLGS